LMKQAQSRISTSSIVLKSSAYLPRCKKLISELLPLDMKSFSRSLTTMMRLNFSNLKIEH